MRKYTECQYRECEKQISNDRRNDAKYCCDKHGWLERNAMKNDDLIYVETQKAFRRNLRIIDDLYKRGKLIFSKEVLEALDFNFEVLTKIKSVGNVFEYEIFGYNLTIKDNLCSIKKL